MNTLSFNKVKGYLKRLESCVYISDNREIRVDDDYYWSVDSSQAFDMSSSPEIMVGSLDDDLNELEKLLLDSERVVTPVDFDRLGNILRYLSKAFVGQK
jgi:hypothetical protein